MRRMGDETSGQATLSFMLLVGSVVIEVAIAASFVVYLLLSSGYGERLSARAFSAAEAGIRDVQVRIARDKEFAQLGEITYSVSVGDDSTTVIVSRNTSNPAGYRYTATSTGHASMRNRRLVGVFIVDQVTGLLQLQSITEKPL